MQSFYDEKETWQPKGYSTINSTLLDKVYCNNMSNKTMYFHFTLFCAAILFITPTNKYSLKKNRWYLSLLKISSEFIVIRRSFSQEYKSLERFYFFFTLNERSSKYFRSIWQPAGFRHVLVNCIKNNKKAKRPNTHGKVVDLQPQNGEKSAAFNS